VVDADSDRDSILHIEVEKVRKKLLAKVKVKTNKQARELTCQLDSATSCNVLARRDYEKLDKPKLHNSNTTLTMYDGRQRKSLGVCQLEIEDRLGKSRSLKFEELETEKLTLLSLETCLKLNLLSYERESVSVVETRRQHKSRY